MMLPDGNSVERAWVKSPFPDPRSAHVWGVEEEDTPSLIKPTAVDNSIAKVINTDTIEQLCADPDFFRNC
jgi:hypothetical protein